VSIPPVPRAMGFRRTGAFSVIAPAFGEQEAEAGVAPAPAPRPRLLITPRQGGLSPFQNCPSLPRIWLLRGFYAVGGSQIAPLPLDRPQNANTGQARTQFASQQRGVSPPLSATKRCQIPHLCEGAGLAGGGQTPTGVGGRASFPLCRTTPALSVLQRRSV